MYTTVSSDGEGSSASLGHLPPPHHHHTPPNPTPVAKPGALGHVGQRRFHLGALGLGVFGMFPQCRFLEYFSCFRSWLRGVFLFVLFLVFPFSPFPPHVSPMFPPLAVRVLERGT